MVLCKQHAVIVNAVGSHALSLLCVQPHQSLACTGCAAADANRIVREAICGVSNRHWRVSSDIKFTQKSDRFWDLRFSFRWLQAVDVMVARRRAA
jgi:hypothetical protein